MPLTKTPLYSQHVSLNGKIVSFAGFLLPTHYSSINHEHNLVRTKVGIFDVSHMGEILISGNDALSFLQKTTINDLKNLEEGQAQYSAMCYEDGGIIDDLLIYKKQNDYMLVVNATNRIKDYEWLLKNKFGDVQIRDVSDSIALIAIQGPYSKSVLQNLTKYNLNNLKYYHFIEDRIDNIEVLISRTGYTGELGYEIYTKPENVTNIWKKLSKVGKNYGIEPVGLACRDTLRLEMKYLLYGSDINEEINPLEAGLGWITKTKEKDFIGKEAILKGKENINKRLVCVQMKERAIPRTGYKIYYKNKLIGEITSGTMSPSLSVGIGIGYLHVDYSNFNEEVHIDIRGHHKLAKIVKPPFYKRGTLMK